MNEVSINILIDRYLNIIEKNGEPGEKYKYLAIQNFQDNWDLDKPNLYEMFKKSFSKKHNLFFKNSWGFIDTGFKFFPEIMRTMFRKLFDEKIELKSRIVTFQDDSAQLLEKISERFPDKKISAQQDERTISAYLTFRYPENYIFYLHKYYKALAKEFNLPNKTNENFLTLVSILTSFKEQIEKHPSFIETYRAFYEKPSWDDTNLMIQNILYVSYVNNFPEVTSKDNQFFENVFLDTVKKLNHSTENFYILLDKLVQDLPLKEDNTQTTFSVPLTKTKLNFIIGQRLVWCLHNHNYQYIFISREIYTKKYDEFDGTSKKYLNYTNDFALVMEKYSEILECAKEELLRTAKSGFSEYTNVFYHKSVFDIKYRNNILRSTSYWIFQGNPKYYDIVGALNANVLTNWQVAAHKDKIKIGDKVILWMTGGNSGCYGLADVTSDVGIIKDNQEEINFYKSDFNPDQNRVGIKIIQNFSANPLLWKDLKLNSILSSLKVGNQGTNFTATEEQYDEILRISQLNQNKMNHPLNQILFGCPGSGKTYSTKKLAVEIIEGLNYSDSKEDREEIIRLYEKFSEQKQIVFTTFHQSLSYEDFIEGIKPIMKNDEDGDLNYEIQNGIFKTLCKTALENNNSQPTDNFDESWEALIELIKTEISNGSLLKIGSWDFGLSSKNSLKYSSLNTPSQYSFTITKQNILDTYQKKKARPSGAFQKDMEDVVEFMKSKFELNDYQNEISVQNQFSNKKYVLIIDEINRGNVSSIFGELITLIEDDKRLGSDEKIEVILPYSKEPFGVPPNLYLIGTMNTADRSVEALDTALRRRFSFIQMKSDPNIIGAVNDNNGILSESPDINLIDLLTKINERIELLLDKDHQIGHSYFIGINTLDELKTTFKNKVIPLLEEYFYGDFGKIGLVLGDQFVETKSLQNNKNILSNFKGYDEVDFLTDKKIYNFKEIDNMVASDFVSIYKTINTISDEA